MSISIIAAAGCQVQPEMSTAASQKNRQESVFASKNSSQQDEVVKNNDYKKIWSRRKRKSDSFIPKKRNFSSDLSQERLNILILQKEMKQLLILERNLI